MLIFEILSIDWKNKQFILINKLKSTFFSKK